MVKVFYGKNKKEAEEKYNKFLKTKALNIDSSKQYFGIMADRWIYDFLVNDESIQNSTVKLYIGNWNKYVKPSKIYAMQLDEVSAGTIQRMYNSLIKEGCPVSAVKAINKMMSRFYKYLVQHGYVPYNFTNTLTIPRIKKEREKEVVTWSDTELSTILNGFEEAQEGFRLRFLLVLAAYTGMRISELLGIKYEDIVETESGFVLNVRRQVANISTFSSDGSETRSLGTTTLKSQDSYRSIPLNQNVIDELRIHTLWHKREQMRKGYRTNFVFTTESGNLYVRKNCERACERYYKRIGVEYKPFHTYRHTFGTNLYKNGVPIITASKLLGHSDISITAKYYIGTDEEEKRKAVEVLSKIV